MGIMEKKTATTIMCYFGFRYPLAHWGNVRVILELYGDDGQENENYYNALYKGLGLRVLCCFGGEYLVHSFGIVSS